MTLDHQKLSTSLRILCADMVEAAKSGHPGLPLGMADVATVLWMRHLKFNPADPVWCDRDRFVLSAGHGSVLLYGLLYLSGVSGVNLEQLKQFRQLHSGTAGHPEYGELPGIETTTGPLGQGLANAVGMAIAERKLAAQFGSDLVDHYTYCLVGDGCLMEGVSQESISLAGHLRLSKLICFWDNNSITIDGSTSLSTSENQIQRFQASGWNTIEIDGHEADAIDRAIIHAKQSDRPILIACKTIIGFGAPNKQGTPDMHGSPLGGDEMSALRDRLQWSHAPFEIPFDILQQWRLSGARSNDAYVEWQQRYGSSSLKHEFDRWHTGDMHTEIQSALHQLRTEMVQDSKPEATRKSSERCLTALVEAVPNLVGGSADLTPSNNTRTKTMSAIRSDSFEGQYIHYGIREHAMAAVMNGISVHTGLRPYGGTFLCFSDYARPSIRLSALMQQPVVYVMTHDSIGLGEDGPTHQPIEHLASLRAMPNVNVFRPCDAVETAECWELAIVSQTTPSILALCRQNLPSLRRDVRVNRSAYGAYVIRPSKGDRTLTLVATGSEVSLAMQAAEVLEQSSSHAVAVVSMPCWELFAAQDLEYQEEVLGDVPRFGIEAACSFGWERWVDHMFGIDTFGTSAPAADVYAHFGLTPTVISESILAFLD
ncbi:transketolase [Candidatus Bodocaedibacter vickermanii]|uniref:Transketolase n=1 Tax=Candidatus Bodocaedibacter vickermanii TaxID=2741701 RepID=A0A7L9RV32_9PROT|nr:Transketolase 1 [Candidatus Paracaedibacteraceae bacterium 'Lake Konstanz']